MDEWVRQAEAWAGQAEHWIRQQPPEQIYVAVAVSAVTILMLVAGEASPRAPSPPRPPSPPRLPSLPRFCPPPRPRFPCASSAMDEWVCQAEAWAGRVEHWICQQTPEQIYLAVAVIAVTVLVLVAASRLKSSKPNTIVLSGLSGSGKTVLFYQLRDGSSHQETVTLMEHNNDTFVLHSELERQGKIKPVHVIDVPGHARLKPKLDEVLPQAAGVVFVVDAQDFLSSVQAAAEYLYDILTKATVLKKRVPVLIFCNKADEVTAHSKEFIKKQLQKEINKLRESRNAISSADITDEVQLGVPGEAFNFSQCQNKVIVAEGAGLTGNVSAVEQFIREYVKP